MADTKIKERATDISRYLPDFLREVQELKQVTETENGEFDRLYEKADDLWENGFIQTSDLQGIKRWENLLSIKAYAGDSLQERRARVLTKWNQQLPYTLKRLQERLDASVGTETYELYLRPDIYELELLVIEQTYRVMNEVREMTRGMIPSNLFFIFAGKVPVVFPVSVAYGNTLEMTAEFYARYNQQFLYLDGSWFLDGTYRLNGYKELDDTDFYPMQLKIGGAFLNNVEANEQLSFQTAGRVSEITDVGMGLQSGASADMVIETEERISQQIRVLPGAECHLKVEKDLWYLDGTYLLDGTKLLDAEIFEYDL